MKLNRFLHLIKYSFDYLLVCTSGLFDSEWYRSHYPDACANGESPLHHYMRLGYLLGYSPSAKFCSERYEGFYTFIKDRKKNPLLHYIKHGKWKGYTRYTFDNNQGKRAVKSSVSPLISVIVTSYNYEQFIGQTLETLVHQTYRNMEIIVVDDGSKDHSINIISDYASKFDFIKLYQHPKGENKGIVPSMQLALSHAKGDYIAFCESDDYWSYNHLEVIIDAIRCYDDIVIISNGVKLIGDTTCINLRGKYIETIKKALWDGRNPIDLQNMPERNLIPTLSAVMIKRDVLSQLDFHSPVLAWIDFWLYRQVLANNPLYHVSDELTFWRQQPNSYNGTSVDDTFKNNMKTFLPLSNKLIANRRI